MKKLFSIFAVSFALLGCANQTDNLTTKPETFSKPVVTPQSISPKTLQSHASPMRVMPHHKKY